MAKKRNTAKRPGNTAKRTGNTAKIYPDLVEKQITMTRTDVAKWKRAWQSAITDDNPVRYMLFNMYENEILMDTTLSSQIENRKNDTLGTGFNLLNSKNEIDPELTEEFQNSELFNDIINAILDTRFQGHSVIELDWKDDELKCELIPRQNVLPVQGEIILDYDFDKRIKYRERPEYGTWLLEFGKDKNLGLLNKAVPHVLFKKFAQSCWSELCEIYGIPPRVYKTDAQDPRALARGKKMMTEMGAAAWFIIDTTEEFEWAQGVSTNGDVYNNLIRLCDNQNSLLIQGAIIGQDTEHGSYGKDAAGQNLLNSLIASDMALVQMYMKTRVIPALIKIGVLPEGTIFKFDVEEDLEALWSKTKELLPYYDVDEEWLRDTFKIEITGKKESPFTNFSAESFFV